MRFPRLRPSVETIVAAGILCGLYLAALWIAFQLWRLSILLNVWVGLLPKACHP